MSIPEGDFQILGMNMSVLIVHISGEAVKLTDILDFDLN
jgi:hypothetical protein